MATELTLEDAYREACKALGESIVTQRLMSMEIERLTTQQETAEQPEQPEQ